MSKLQLKAKNLGATEVLSREQLKKVLSVVGGGSEPCFEGTCQQDCDPYYPGNQCGPGRYCYVYEVAYCKCSVCLDG